MATQRVMLPQSIRFSVFRRDRFTCRYCGRSAPAVVLHVEHVRPVAKGGTDDMENLVTSCADCNGGKGAQEGVVPPTTLEKGVTSPGLGGLWAHEKDEDGYAKRQMMILREAAPGRWLVQLFSWLDGGPTCSEVIDESLLLSAAFVLYGSSEQMRDAYDSGRMRHPEWRRAYP